MDLQSKFDIVIPIGPDDIDIIHDQIEYTKRNVIGYRNIYIIRYNPTLEVKDCIMIGENIFPFSKSTVENYGIPKHRSGWYLQQLLKLYSGIVIPGILERYLVIDGDTFFLKPVQFMEDDYCLYSYLGENWNPYFEHILNIHPSFEKFDETKSGITHHMMLETKYVREMMDMVITYHNIPEFYDIYLQFILHQKTNSGASEYELYFNFIQKYHPDAIKLRYLNYKGKKRCLDFTGDTECDYVSVHSWIQS